MDDRMGWDQQHWYVPHLITQFSNKGQHRYVSVFQLDFPHCRCWENGTNVSLSRGDLLPDKFPRGMQCKLGRCLFIGMLELMLNWAACMGMGEFIDSPKENKLATDNHSCVEFLREGKKNKETAADLVIFHSTVICTVICTVGGMYYICGDGGGLNIKRFYITLPSYSVKHFSCHCSNPEFSKWLTTSIPWIF